MTNAGPSGAGLPICERLRFCADHPRMTYPDAVGTVLEAAALIEALYETGKKLDDFAWGACVQTDCDESRDYLQSLIDGLRSALRASEQGK